MDLEKVAREIAAIVGKGSIQTHPAERLVYECDGLTFHRNPPDIVVYPSTAEQVQGVAQIAYDNDVPYLPRGAGTSLSGGAIPISGGILLQMSRLEFDLAPFAYSV